MASAICIVLLAVFAALQPIGVGAATVRTFPRLRGKLISRILKGFYVLAILVLGGLALYFQYAEQRLTKAEAKSDIANNAKHLEEIRRGILVAEKLSFQAQARSLNKIADKVSAATVTLAMISKKLVPTESPFAAKFSGRAPALKPRATSRLTIHRYSSPKATPMPTSSQSPVEVTQSNLPPLWAPIEQQKSILLGLIAQTSQASDASGIWLSQIVDGLSEGKYDGVPPPDTVDFPAALRQLESDRRVVITGEAARSYRWGRFVFSADLKFRAL